MLGIPLETKQDYKHLVIRPENFTGKFLELFKLLKLILMFIHSLAKKFYVFVY